MTVDTVPIDAVNTESLVRMMVGRELKDMYPRRPISKGETLFEVKGLSAGERLHDIGFSVRRGEIVVIYGLLGAGQNELGLALFGEIPLRKGQILLEGAPVRLHSPGDACRIGIGLISDDRKRDGLVPVMDLKENISLVSLRRYARYGILKSRDEEREAGHWVRRLQIRCSSMKQQIRFLSGGNQQKAIIARWLANRSKVLILNLPTRGVDVGAKVEIYKLLEDLCEQGVGIIIISLEMPEVLGIADRILVMHKDTIVAEMAREEASQDKLLRSAMGMGHGAGGGEERFRGLDR
jgi:ABC-type sugar transport system ATPase subunit